MRRRMVAIPALIPAPPRGPPARPPKSGHREEAPTCCRNLIFARGEAQVAAGDSEGDVLPGGCIGD